MNVHFNINLKKKQKEIYDAFKSDYKYIIAAISRQLGKSTIAEILCIETLLKVKNANVIYITPTFTLGRKIYKEIVSLLTPTNLIKSANATTLTIELFNNGSMQFFSAEAPQAMRGQTAKGLLVMDECAFLPDTLPNGDTLYGNIVQPLTKAHKPKVLFISTPAGKTGLFYEFALRGMNEENGYKFIKGQITDDEGVTEEEIEEIKRTIPPLAFRQEYMVEFLDSALTALNGFEDCFTDNYAEPSLNEQCWIGIDFSSVGSDETILTVVNKLNKIKQYKIEGTLDQKYKRIADIINSYNKLQVVYAETNSIGEVMINEIKKYVKNKGKIREFLTTNDTKTECIGLLQTLIANHNITFDKKEKELFQQMGVFVYSITKTKKITYAAKPPFHDDRIMSLAIALQAKEDIKSFDTNKDVHFIRTRVKNIG